MDDVASDLITNIEGYQQLLTTLSLGVCAGVFALVTQIVFHNVQNQSSRVFVNASGLLIVAVVFHLVAIGFGVATKAALVASVPALHQIKWTDESATATLATEGLSGITTSATWQIFFFALGMLTLLVVLICNLKHLTQR